MLAEVQKHTLPNGLTVLLRPDSRVPLVCVLTWVNVGYFDEPDHLTGISHFLEHLFFKGTPTRGVGAIAQETKAAGGYLNAATIYDHTYYYTVVPASGWKTAIDIQADALRNPLFDPEEMEREKSVIVQELNRKYDNPHPYAWEKLLEMAFSRHYLRRWRMGTEEIIRRYPRDEVISFYNRFYTPSNVALVISGSFSPDEVMREIEARYASMPNIGVSRQEIPEEPTQTEPRMARMAGDLSLSLVKMGFHSAPIGHPDFYPLTFLSTILGRGRSSRLYRTLKEEKGLVDGIGTSLFASNDIGFFAVEAELKADKIAACEEEIWAELDRVRRDPPTAEEVEKVRNIIETNFFQEKQDVMGQAYSLAHFESLGGYQLALEYVNKMRAVTPDEIVDVVERYFTFSKLNLLEYVPRDVGEGASPELRLESLKKRVAARAEKAGPVIPPPKVPPVEPLSLSGSTAQPRDEEPVVVPIGGGVELLHLRVPSLPLVSTAVFFPGGRLEETEANCGITNFALLTSLKGTENRTADEIAFESEVLGTSIRVEANADLFGYSMGVLGRNVPRALDLLSDVILHPRFDEREVEKERASTLASIRRSRDDMFRYPIELFYHALYGVHPYGLPRYGTVKSVDSFTSRQLQEWYGQLFRWRKMVVAMVGDIEREAAVRLVKERFSVSGDSDEEPRAKILPALTSRGVREQVESRDRKQTGMAVGFAGLSLRDDRIFALEVLRNVLSGMGGRLFMELREKNSLVYTVTAFNIGLLRSGAFFIYLAAAADKEAEAYRRLIDELNDVRNRLVTDAELAAAKKYSKGSRAVALQGNGSVAYEYIHQYVAGRGLEGVREFDERIDAVTADDVRAVARDVIDASQTAKGIVRGGAA